MDGKSLHTCSVRVLATSASGDDSSSAGTPPSNGKGVASKSSHFFERKSRTVPVACVSALSQPAVLANMLRSASTAPKSASP
jgi:hypothetical protein